MNIKRMADGYRERILGTGQDVKEEFDQVKKDYYRIDSLQHRLGTWKACLKRAGIEDLKLLESSWQIVRQVNQEVRFGKRKYHQRTVTKENFSQIKIAEKEFDKFLKVLPELLEQALTRAVRESGIRL
jgi:hypothetical protein